MKFETAEELIARRNELRKLSWEQRLNRFRTKETKDLLDRAGITDFTIFNNYMHYYGRE